MTLPDRLFWLLARCGGLFTDAEHRVAAALAIAVGYPDVSAVQDALRCLHRNGLIATPLPDSVRLSTSGRAAAGLAALVRPDVDIEGEGVIRFFAPAVGIIVPTARNPERWREVIAKAARRERDPFDGPLAFDAVFFMPRPKNFPKIKAVPMTRRPLLHHLERACFDGLRGSFFADDAQVTDSRTSKRYASPTQEVGVRITLREATWGEEVVA